MKKKYLIVIVLFLLFFTSLTQSQEREKSRPNVIFILADDLGFETLKINGGESYSTPNIDRMASEGMRFEHCYAQPQCTPSRVKLLTGMYNVRNYENFGELDTTQTTIAQLFREAGYVTGVAGKWQLGKTRDNPSKLGFDDYMLWQVTRARVDSIGWDSSRFPGKGFQAGGRDTRYSRPMLDHNGVVKTYAEHDYGPKIINDFGLEFIERNNKAKKPFFLFYSMILTHCPFSPTPDSDDFMVNDTTVMTYKGNKNYFGEMVTYMDKMIGNIDQKLKDLGIYENTLVVFTGDNGTDTPIVSRFKGKNVPGGKLLSTDAGTRVPLVVKWPGKIKENKINKDLVDFSDFMPTMLEAAEIEIPQSTELDGRSYLPQLFGKKGKPRNWVYSWYLRPGTESPRVFARNRRYKLYDTGELYDVSNDVLEEHQISYEALNAKMKMTQKKLQSVISYYEERRLNAIKK